MRIVPWSLKYAWGLDIEVGRLVLDIDWTCTMFHPKWKPRFWGYRRMGGIWASLTLYKIHFTFEWMTKQAAKDLAERRAHIAEMWNLACTEPEVHVYPELWNKQGGAT
jgi:hypothetical protein